ncbi:hypothetical protein D3C81_1524380 [compost metagenome]
MVDRLFRRTLLQMPARSHPVQFGGLAGTLTRQFLAEEAGEQGVIAEPALFLVQREQEQIRLQQILDHPLAVLAAGQRIAERRAELLEHTGPEQEATALLALPGEDFVGEETGQFHMGTGKRPDECLRIIAAMQRQRGKAKCRHPALGTAMQAGDIAFAQAQLVPVTQE